MIKFEQYLLKHQESSYSVDDIQDMNRQTFAYFVKNNFVKNTTFDLEIQHAIVERGVETTYYDVIKYINNPKKEVQLHAVSAYGYAIEYIKNPDQDVQLAAVKEDGRSIDFVDNPNKAVKLAAVNNRGISIKYIQNHDYDIQLAAVKEDGRSIEYITSSVAFIHDDIFIAAIKQNKRAITFVKGLSDEYILKVLKLDQNLIKEIKNEGGNRRLSKSTQEFLISKMPELLSKYPQKFSPSIKRKYSYLKLAGEIGVLD